MNLTYFFLTLLVSVYDLSEAVCQFSLQTDK